MQISRAFLRIGIYDPYLDDLGGGEKYMMTIAECLAKNHHVSVFWDNKNDLDKIKKRFSLDLKDIKLKKNIFDQRISFPERVFETKKYDVLIILSDGSIPFVLSKKLFLHLQQPLKQINQYSFKDKIKLSRVSAFFCNSQYTQSFNKKILFGAEMKIIYPPVDLVKRNILKENIILHVGRFRVRNVGVVNYKKQNIMIEAFKKMVDKERINKASLRVKNWKFIIAASVNKKDEERFTQLKKMAAGYPIDFFVNKTNDQLWGLYYKSKIYWHASGFGEDLNKNPEYAEHFGISTVEAMGAGAVPVTFNAGGQKEVVDNGENGYLWNNLEEFAEKTLQLMESEKLWEEMSKKARLKAESFSKNNFCKEINQLVME